MHIQEGSGGYRNGEGYHDPTAGAAMRNAGASKKCNGGVGKEKAMKFYTGDIWECIENTGMTGTYVIISAHEKYATTVRLVSTPTTDTPYKMVARREMWTDPGKVSFVTSDRLQNFIRTMTEEETVNLRKAVRKALGFDSEEAEDPDITEELKARAKKAEDRAIELEKKVQSLFDELQETKKQTESDGKLELVKAQTQRDIYKGLYEETLDRMIDMA